MPILKTIAKEADKKNVYREMVVNRRFRERYSQMRWATEIREICRVKTFILEVKSGKHNIMPTLYAAANAQESR